MRLYEIKEAGRGQGKFGEWIRITAKDDQGRTISSFDEFLLDIADGTEVPGKLTIEEKDGRTYYNFKADKHMDGGPVSLGRPEAPKSPQNGPGSTNIQAVDVNAAMARAIEFVNARQCSVDYELDWKLVETYTEKALTLQQKLLSK